jgi:DNA polymerase II large subunit
MKKVSTVHCIKCGQTLQRIVAGNIIDYLHVTKCEPTAGALPLKVAS